MTNARKRFGAAFLAALVALAPAAAFAQHDGHDHSHDHAAHAAATPTRDAALPAGEDAARQALDASPRHGELVDVPLPDGKTMRAWIVFPERKDKAGVVIVIHEIFGLSDWIRGVADQLAKEGFIAVAPDLISGYGPGGGGTESVSSRDSVVQLVRNVTPAVATERLDAVRAWALAQPAASGRSATIGYCWGGSRSFGYATTQKGLNAAVVYYGGSPDSAAITQTYAPVLGLYAGDDARVNATIEPAQRVAKAAKKSYEVNVYDGAGHGFLRQQTGRDGANLRATQKAWPRTIAFLREHLEGKAKKK